MSQNGVQTDKKRENRGVSPGSRVTATNGGFSVFISRTFLPLYPPAPEQQTQSNPCEEGRMEAEGSVSAGLRNTTIYIYSSLSTKQKAKSHWARNLSSYASPEGAGACNYLFTNERWYCVCSSCANHTPPCSMSNRK